ncbi:MAG TPA: excinuclease ABC subunit A, partial [Dehalococcoidia bacterium]|nr:excinuclease ABC subunit A [Dehalococcoidia bacterium]
VRNLLAVLQRLVDGGNTVVVIEHHLDVMLNADHIIDLGPQGGHRGGQIIAYGTPEQVAQDPGSLTARFLRDAFASRGIKIEPETAAVSPKPKRAPRKQKVASKA